MGCVHTLESTFGYMFLFAKGVISWKSVKQTLIASSNMEDEFVPCYEAISQVVWLKNSILRPITILCDNLVVVFFSKNNKCSSKSKHIELEYLVVYERLQNKKVSIEHISTKLMIVDLMNKALMPKVYKDHVLSIGLINDINHV